MSDELIGIERDVVLSALIHDKATITISPVVKKNVKAENMILQNTEYKIYPQGIVFFKRFLSQWQAIDNVLDTNEKNNVKMNVSFYYKGRGLYGISTLKKVQNGYVVILPTNIQKMNSYSDENAKIVSGKIFLSGFTGVHSVFEQLKDFPLFDNKLWQHFSRNEFERAQYFLKNIATLEEIQLEEVCEKLIQNTKLLLYFPEKKIPKRNFFPFPLSITTSHIEDDISEPIRDFVSNTPYKMLVPLSESPKKDVYTILGMKPKMVSLTPNDVLDTLLMLPVCRYLIKDNKTDISPSVQTTLSVLCITDTSILFGYQKDKKHIFSSTKKSGEWDFPLAQGQEYSLQLNIPVRSMLRTIVLSFSVVQIFKDEKRVGCALCRYTSLQEEDRRFLYEKFTKSKLR